MLRDYEVKAIYYLFTRNHTDSVVNLPTISCPNLQENYIVVCFDNCDDQLTRQFLNYNFVKLQYFGCLLFILREEIIGLSITLSVSQQPL